MNLRKLFWIVGLLLILVATPFILYHTVGEKEYLVVREVEIATPVGFVFQFMLSHQARTRWHPVLQLDSQVQYKILGDDGYVGSIFVWEGPVAGKGEERLFNFQPFYFFETEFKMFEPYHTEGIASLQMADEGDIVRVVWGIKGKNDWKTTMKLLLHGTTMKEILGHWLEIGLEKFKQVAEQAYLDELARRANQEVELRKKQEAE